MTNNINYDVTKQTYDNRENLKSHLPYDREVEFYKKIQSGNIEELNKLFKPLDSNELGKLSEDPIRNLKYHLIITTALITRYCIEGGMDMETAFTLSDTYINKVDKCTLKKQITDLHHEIVETYAKKMCTLLKKNPLSKPVTKGIDYIYKNLHTRLSLCDIAEFAGCSPSYFSRLFHSEIGTTVKGYIIEKRLDEAKNLLIFTDQTIAEIASTLDFSSESHFIKVFKKSVSVTPAKFRKNNYRKNIYRND